MTMLPDAEAYNTFIESLELKNLRLVEAELSADTSGPEGELQVSLRDEYNHRHTDSGFEALAKYTLEFYRDNQLLASVKATFGLEYLCSATPKDIDKYFEIFKQTTLPLNAWPFAREFFHNMTGRMGWSPFTLPLFKVSLAPPKKAGRQPAKPSAKPKGGKRKG